MNYNKKIHDISNLFSLYGSMGSLISGKVKKTESGAFEYQGEGYLLTSDFTEHKSGVTVRKDSIKNTGDKPISITSILSAFDLNGGEWEVYSQYSQTCDEGFGSWERLNTEISASSSDVRINTASSPMLALYNLQNGRGVVFHIVTTAMWKMSAKKLQIQGRKLCVRLEMGFNDRDFQYTLEPGESLELPEILFYEFTNKVDLDAYKLHRYCNDRYPSKPLPCAYNTWLAAIENLRFDFLENQAVLAKKLGIEYYVVDAGWFGEPGLWHESVGDWEEFENGSLRGKLFELSEVVRKNGLKFGLWFEIERANAKAKNVALHPDFYIFEGGHYFVNFANPDACDFIFELLSERIRKYKIEFIKFDFNAALTYDALRHAFIDYSNGFSSLIARLKKAFPELYCEGCASGGMRMALANLDVFDSFWLSDDHSQYRELEIFKNTIKRLPPRSLEKWLTVSSHPHFTPVPNKEGWEDKVLVSGDAGWEHLEAIHLEFMDLVMKSGPVGLTCDLAQFAPSLSENITQLIREFKEEREFWQTAECRILTDTASLTVIQFNDEAFSKVKVFVFVKIAEQGSVTIYPLLDKDAEYLQNGEDVSACELLSDGFECPVGKRYTAHSFEFIKK